MKNNKKYNYVKYYLLYFNKKKASTHLDHDSITLQATVDWFKIYKIPAGSAENKFAFNDQAKNKVHVHEALFYHLNFFSQQGSHDFSQ